jgi:hypothetical protein
LPGSPRAASSRLERHQIVERLEDRLEIPYQENNPQDKNDEKDKADYFADPMTKPRSDSPEQWHRRVLLLVE